MKKHKGLNGNTWMVIVIPILIGQTITGLISAGSIKTDVKNLKEEVQLVKQDVKSFNSALSADIKDIYKTLARSR
ncbi:MAG: hypothetical protein ACHQ1D_00765 [Nitrososphaerales archaeon]